MNPIMVIAALFGAAGIMVIFVGIATARRASEGAEEVQNRLFQYGVGSAPAAAAPARTTPRSPREVIAGLFEPAAQRLGQGNVKRGKKPLAEQLQKADLKLRTSEFIAIQFGTVALLALIAFLRWGIIQALVAGVLGYFIPGFYVRYRMGKRLKAFNNQLGDTLVLLSNALKAGYSFAQAVDTVAKNAVPPMSDEFSRAVREMNLGGSVEEALNNMLKRIESPDFDRGWQPGRDPGQHRAHDPRAHPHQGRDQDSHRPGLGVGHTDHDPAHRPRDLPVLRHAGLLQADD